MTIETDNGNAFDGTGDAVVVTVNCVGAMGRGIAEECRRRMRWLYQSYKVSCNRRKIQPGRITTPWCVFEGGSTKQDSNHDVVVLFPTKDDWKRPSRIEWIESGLADLCALAEQRGWKTVDMTLPGGANGWIKDKSLIWKAMEKHLGSSSVEFRVWGLH